MEELGGENSDAQAALDIRDRLHAAAAEEQTAVMESFIKEHVARVLGTSANRIEVDRSLNELGLDSLMAVELKNRIEADLQLSLSAAKLVSGPSIEELSKNVLDVFAASEAKQAPSPTMAPPRVEPSTPEVDQLSDQEVDLLLKKMLDEEAVAISDAEEGALS